MKLTDIQKYHPHQMRNAVRTFRNKSILESRTPQSGAYWWIPKPDGTWYLEIFYDSEYNNNTMHDEMWRSYVVETLATLYNKDPNKLRRKIGDNYTGLPRGRVNKIYNGYTIVHGNNAPVSKAIPMIMNKFNLKALHSANPKSVRAMFDDHEVMSHGDPEAVQAAIGVNLGLKGVMADFGDDDDYGDDL